VVVVVIVVVSLIIFWFVYHSYIDSLHPSRSFSLLFSSLFLLSFFSLSLLLTLHLIMISF